MNAPGGVRGVCERRYGRIQVMDASLAAAGGKPARISSVVLVDRQGWIHDVSILIAGAGGLGR
jgi:hypothetical protein